MRRSSRPPRRRGAARRSRRSSGSRAHLAASARAASTACPSRVSSGGRDASRSVSRISAARSSSAPGRRTGSGGSLGRRWRRRPQFVDLRVRQGFESAQVSPVAGLMEAIIDPIMGAQDPGNRERAGYLLKNLTPEISSAQTDRRRDVTELLEQHQQAVTRYGGRPGPVQLRGPIDQQLERVSDAEFVLHSHPGCHFSPVTMTIPFADLGRSPRRKVTDNAQASSIAESFFARRSCFSGARGFSS